MLFALGFLAGAAAGLAGAGFATGSAAAAGLAVSAGFAVTAGFSTLALTTAADFSSFGAAEAFAGAGELAFSTLAGAVLVALAGVGFGVLLAGVVAFFTNLGVAAFLGEGFAGIVVDFLVVLETGMLFFAGLGFLAEAGFFAAGLALIADFFAGALFFAGFATDLAAAFLGAGLGVVFFAAILGNWNTVG